jgi:carboxyl-terminal processing protease
MTASATILFGLTVFMLGYLWGTYAPDGLAQAQSSQPAQTEELFKPFWEAWTLLHENYVEPLDDTELMEGALTGMMEAVGDPHTDYMNPDTFAHVNAAMNGAYEGIGATVRQDEATGGLELVSIMDDSPAEEAGLLPGDVIVEVEGEDVTGLTQNEIIAQVRGPAGSTVNLGIQRADVDRILQFEVERRRISVPSVTYELLDDGEIGYIRLSQFEFGTADALRDALTALDANNLKGLILDVRGDPGGYLTTAIEVASAFVEDGTVVIEKGPQRDYTYQALGNPIAPDVPLVVLVDAGSASASELISGALQDLGRATIVGMPTFGKGSVQTWHTLSNGGGIRITISRWYTPEGRSVSEVGIEPDILIPFNVNALSGQDTQLQAAIQLLNGVEVRSAEIDLPEADEARTVEAEQTPEAEPEFEAP